MKQKLLIITLLTFSISLFSQYSRESLWTGAMNNFAAEDASFGVQKDVVLFAGSSSLAIWTYAQNDFPDSKILNRAFGGSVMTDLIYFFSKVILPYQPKQVVVYEGDNDLHLTSKTPEEYMEDVITLSRLINIYYPNTKVLLISVKPSPSRKVSFPKYLIANQLMKDYADKYNYIDFVDVWTPMLNTEGEPDTSYFRSDMLHLNYYGYDLWKTILKPHLLKSDSVIIGTTDSGDVYFGSDFNKSVQSAQGNRKNKDFHQPVIYENGNMLIAGYSGKIEVFDLEGRSVMEGSAILGELQVNLDPGVYIVKTDRDKSKMIVHE